MTGQHLVAIGLAAVPVSGPPLRPAPALAQADSLPAYARDRGSGVPASIFGTYLRRRELVIYPFFEYTLDNNREYQPQQTGVGPDVNFRGRFRGTSSQVFVGYGVTEWLALELEGAYVSARLEKSPNDTFVTAAITRESGLTDLEGQVRARLVRETTGHPELFGFVELVARSQRGKVLIEEANWDAKPGIGLVRGFGFGTVTVRIAAEYNRADHHPDLGEFAVEYLKRCRPRLTSTLVSREARRDPRRMGPHHRDPMAAHDLGRPQARQRARHFLEGHRLGAAGRPDDPPAALSHAD